MSIVQLAVKDHLEAAGEKLHYAIYPDLVHAYSILGDMAAAHQTLNLLPSIDSRSTSHVHKQTHAALLDW